MRPNHGVHRASPLPSRSRPFSRNPTVSLRTPSAANLRLRLHPPASFSPPPEFCDKRPAPRVSKDLATFRSTGERLPWGSVPHRGVNQRRPPPARESPPELCSVLGVSHALDGLLRHQPLRVCFTPQPRPGFALQGFIPLHGAVPGFPGRVMPSCRLTHPPVTSECALDFRALLPAVSAVPSGTG